MIVWPFKYLDYFQRLCYDIKTNLGRSDCIYLVCYKINADSVASLADEMQRFKIEIQLA